MEYRRRIADDILREKLQVFGAVLITNPKGCGKTTTAKRQSASFIEFQDEDRRERYLSVARTMPSKLLEGEHPRLIRQCNEDEKQMPLELPSLKIVITGTEYGYRRDDGVLVIPIACLRDRRAYAQYRGPLQDSSMMGGGSRPRWNLLRAFLDLTA